jgi:hypothetical protein
VTSTAIWNVGRVTQSQRRRTLELVAEVKQARKEVEQASEVASIQSVRFRNMAGELVRENNEALQEASDNASHPSGR